MWSCNWRFLYLVLGSLVVCGRNLKPDHRHFTKLDVEESFKANLLCQDCNKQLGTSERIKDLKIEGTIWIDEPDKTALKNDTELVSYKTDIYVDGPFTEGDQWEWRVHMTNFRVMNCPGAFEMEILHHDQLLKKTSVLVDDYPRAILFESFDEINLAAGKNKNWTFDDWAPALTIQATPLELHGTQYTQCGYPNSANLITPVVTTTFRNISLEFDHYFSIGDVRFEGISRGFVEISYTNFDGDDTEVLFQVDSNQGSTAHKADNRASPKHEKFVLDIKEDTFQIRFRSEFDRVSAYWAIDNVLISDGTIRPPPPGPRALPTETFSDVIFYKYDDEKLQDLVDELVANGTTNPVEGAVAILQSIWITEEYSITLEDDAYPGFKWEIGRGLYQDLDDHLAGIVNSHVQSGNAILNAPRVDASQFTNVFVEFENDFHFSQFEKGYFEVFRNDNWEVVDTYTSEENSNGDVQLTDVDLSAYISSNLQFRFRYEADSLGRCSQCGPVEDHCPTTDSCSNARDHCLISYGNKVLLSHVSESATECWNAAGESEWDRQGFKLFQTWWDCQYWCNQAVSDLPAFFWVIDDVTVIGQNIEPVDLTQLTLTGTTTRSGVWKMRSTTGKRWAIEVDIDSGTKANQVRSAFNEALNNDNTFMAATCTSSFLLSVWEINCPKGSVQIGFKNAEFLPVYNTSMEINGITFTDVFTSQCSQDLTLKLELMGDVDELFQDDNSTDYYTGFKLRFSDGVSPYEVLLKYNPQQFNYVIAQPDTTLTLISQEQVNQKLSPLIVWAVFSLMFLSCLTLLTFYNRPLYAIEYNPLSIPSKKTDLQAYQRKQSRYMEAFGGQGARPLDEAIDSKFHRHRHCPTMICVTITRLWFIWILSAAMFIYLLTAVHNNELGTLKQFPTWVAGFNERNYDIYDKIDQYYQAELERQQDLYDYQIGACESHLADMQGVVNDEQQGVSEFHRDEMDSRQTDFIYDQAARQFAEDAQEEMEDYHERALVEAENLQEQLASLHETQKVIADMLEHLCVAAAVTCGVTVGLGCVAIAGCAAATLAFEFAEQMLQFDIPLPPPQVPQLPALSFVQIVPEVQEAIGQLNSDNFFSALQEFVSWIRQTDAPYVAFFNVDFFRFVDVSQLISILQALWYFYMYAKTIVVVLILYIGVNRVYRPEKVKTARAAASKAVGCCGLCCIKTLEFIDAITTNFIAGAFLIGGILLAIIGLAVIVEIHGSVPEIFSLQSLKDLSFFQIVSLPMSTYVQLVNQKIMDNAVMLNEQHMPEYQKQMNVRLQAFETQLLEFNNEENITLDNFNVQYCFSLDYICKFEGGTNDIARPFAGYCFEEVEIVDEVEEEPDESGVNPLDTWPNNAGNYGFSICPALFPDYNATQDTPTVAPVTEAPTVAPPSPAPTPPPREFTLTTENFPECICPTRVNSFTLEEWCEKIMQRNARTDNLAACGFQKITGRIFVDLNLTAYEDEMAIAMEPHIISVGEIINNTIEFLAFIVLFIIGYGILVRIWKHYFIGWNGVRSNWVVERQMLKEEWVPESRVRPTRSDSAAMVPGMSEMARIDEGKHDDGPPNNDHLHIPELDEPNGRHSSADRLDIPVRGGPSDSISNSQHDQQAGPERYSVSGRSDYESREVAERDFSNDYYLAGPEQKTADRRDSLTDSADYSTSQR